MFAYLLRDRDLIPLNGTASLVSIIVCDGKMLGLGKRGLAVSLTTLVEDRKLMSPVT